MDSELTDNQQEFDNLSTAELELMLETEQTRHKTLDEDIQATMQEWRKEITQYNQRVAERDFLKAEKIKYTEIYRPIKREYVSEYRQTCINAANKV